MTSSLKRRSLSKPERGVAINNYDLGFVRGRNKNKAHSLILEIFRDSGLTKAELARMLGKKPEQITRWLAGPGNLTLDTLSELIFATKGEFFEVKCVDELARGKSNKSSPEWLVEVEELTNWQTIKVDIDRGSTSDAFHAKHGDSTKYSIVSSTKGQEYERFEAS
ncbi:helix-turn-helix transcriptional regulator [Ruegeria sp. HKCCD7255]|uniref:helix-turn-helix domain-containing protein n=1 Tax=Ruegeria sp. HKCCD7255 TaxID=2683004 RepID=UPI0014884AB5|nr:helix-turn-helix transcriptional regulator [Ruegeria sp. HKCCD7255]